MSVRDRRVERGVERILNFVTIAKTLSVITFALGDGQELMFFNQFVVPNFTGESPLLLNISLPIHIITGLLFFCTWFVHIGRGLKHQLSIKDRLLNRMLPFTHQ